MQGAIHILLPAHSRKWQHLPCASIWRPSQRLLLLAVRPLLQHVDGVCLVSHGCVVHGVAPHVVLK